MRPAGGGKVREHLEGQEPPAEDEEAQVCWKALEWLAAAAPKDAKYKSEPDNDPVTLKNLKAHKSFAKVKIATYSGEQEKFTEVANIVINHYVDKLDGTQQRDDAEQIAKVLNG